MCKDSSSPSTRPSTKWAAKQIEEPWLRFGGEDGPAAVDPTVKTENISTDAIEATALGLKNLNRVIEMLPSATTQLGEDFSLMQDTYKTVLTHRRNWFNAVALLVGGVIENRTLGGRGTESFTRVPKDKQREAVKFLLDNAFTTPRNLLQPSIVNRIKYFGVADDIMGQQRALLESLLSARRFKQLMDAEVLDPDTSYAAMQLLTDVQTGIFSELKDKQPAIDVLRRNLQRGYIDYVKRGELRPRTAAARRNCPSATTTRFPAPAIKAPTSARWHVSPSRNWSRKSAPPCPTRRTRSRASIFRIVSANWT